MKVENHVKYQDGMFQNIIQVKDEAGVVIASNVSEISAPLAIEAIVKATPTQADDKLLPYIQMLTKLIPAQG